MCGYLLCDPRWALAGNPGMCPDWESNQRPLGLQASTQLVGHHSTKRKVACLIPGRAYARVVASVPVRVRGSQATFLSRPSSLPSHSLKINK